MIPFLLLSILIFNVMFSYGFIGFKKNPFLIFNVWWLIWITLSYLNITNFYVVSDATYIWVTLSVLVVNIIAVFFKDYKLKPFSGITTSYLKFSGVVEVVYLFSLIFFAIKMYFLMAGGENYWKVRFYFYGLELDGEVVNFFSTPLVAHLFYLLKAFSVVNFIVGMSLFNSGKGRFLFFLPIFNIILFCLIAAGRDVIFYMVIIFIFSLKSGRFLYYSKYYSLIGVFVLYMTTLRGGLDTAFYALISYFTGPIIYMDLLIRDVGQFYNGTVVLSLLFSPLIYFSNLITGAEVPNSYTVVGQELMESVQISDFSPFYDYFNALPTWYYFFYRDFGYAGFLIYPIILSIVVMLFYSKLSIFKNEHLALMSYIEACLLWSIFRPEVLGFYNILIILAVVFYFKGDRDAARNFSNRL
tara:strand:- start:10248 stop:11486 length:1239 start_codon:yes stop_codon:yes gene_type:complete